jgi:hypothetical protein
MKNSPALPRASARILRPRPLAANIAAGAASAQTSTLQRRNMMALDDGQLFARGNKAGLHDSHFWRFSPKATLTFNDVRREKNLNDSESAKSGYCDMHSTLG